MFAIKILIFLLVFPSLIYGAKPFTIEFVSYKHEYNSDYYKLIDLRLINYSKRLALNGSVIYRNSINKFNFKFKLDANDTKSKKSWKVFDLKGDGCKLLASSYQRGLSLVQTMLGSIKNYGNLLPTKCPFVKDKLHTIQNFTIDAQLIPLRFPGLILNFEIVFSNDSLPYYTGIFELIIKAN